MGLEKILKILTYRHISPVFTFPDCIDAFGYNVTEEFDMMLITRTTIFYRCTVLPTICAHRLRLSGVLLPCTSSLELSRDIHNIGEHFQ